MSVFLDEIHVTQVVVVPDHHLNSLLLLHCSQEYQQYICERVFANDFTHCLLWETAEYNRGAKIKMHHMAISLQWLKDMDAPEYRAVHLLQKHKNKIIKFADLPKKLGVCQ